MIAESFDTRTRARMEVALEQACKTLSTVAEQHWARRYIASKIVERAEDGDRTLVGLKAAGRAAAHEICTALQISASRRFGRISRLLRGAKRRLLFGVDHDYVR